MGITDILIAAGLLGAGIFALVKWIGGRNANNSGGSGNIPDTSSAASATGDSVGKNRVNTFLDRVRDFLSRSRTKNDSGGNSKDSGG